MATQNRDTMKDYFLLFKNRKFLYLWFSQILSQLTINILNFVLLIHLFAETESTIATSFLWVAYALPAIFIGPFASVSVDLFEKRKILILTNLLQSLTVFLYALVHETQVFLLYGVAMTYSFLNQFYVPAESASMPSLVKKESLAQANGLFFLTQQSALVLGFGFAGVFNQFLGFERTLFLCSAFLFFAFISVNFLPRLQLSHLSITFEGAFFEFFERIKEGYGFIKGNLSVLIPFGLLLIFQIFLAVIMVNVPLIAKELLKISVNSAGLTIVVPAGLGAAAAAIIIPRLLKKKWRKKKVIELSLFLLCLAIFILTFITPEIVNQLGLILAMVAISWAGFAYVGIFIPSQTMLQEATPGGLRGRVFGNFWFLVTIATIFPVIFSGTLAELLGIRFLMIVLGTTTLGALIVSKKVGQKVLQNGFNLDSF